MLPTFLIVGAMKAGTTSFASMLATHPMVYIPAKEIHFFDVDAAYRQGIDGYTQSFAAGEAKHPQVVGEKTPTYSYNSQVPERIKSTLPNVKLIWLLREPAVRAYSHYQFFVQRGQERLSFERAIEAEARHPRKPYTRNYRDRSVYVTQIERYLRYFSRDQMLFLLFEDFIAAPQAVLARTCDFLAIDAHYSFGERPHERNVTTALRSPTLQWAAYQLFHRRGWRLMSMISRFNRLPATVKYPPMNPQTEAMLRQFYREYNQSLSKLIEIDLQA